MGIMADSILLDKSVLVFALNMGLTYFTIHANSAVSNGEKQKTLLTLQRLLPQTLLF